MKQIFLSIQDRLATLVPALRYIDKNWNQLNMPQPPVQWPCCLIDLDSIDYSQTSSADRLADATIILTVATQHTVRSSAKATTKADAYDILDVLESTTYTPSPSPPPGSNWQNKRARPSKPRPLLPFA